MTKVPAAAGAAEDAVAAWRTQALGGRGPSAWAPSGGTATGPARPSSTSCGRTAGSGFGPPDRRAPLTPSRPPVQGTAGRARTSAAVDQHPRPRRQCSRRAGPDLPREGDCQNRPITITATVPSPGTPRGIRPKPGSVGPALTPRTLTLTRPRPPGCLRGPRAAASPGAPVTVCLGLARARRSTPEHGTPSPRVGATRLRAAAAESAGNFLRRFVGASRCACRRNRAGGRAPEEGGPGYRLPTRRRTRNSLSSNTPQVNGFFPVCDAT